MMAETAAKWFLLAPGGKQIGPLSLDEMKEMAMNDKKVLKVAFVWRKGLKEWIPIAEALGLSNAGSASPSNTASHQNSPMKESSPSKPSKAAIRLAPTRAAPSPLGKKPGVLNASSLVWVEKRTESTELVYYHNIQTNEIRLTKPKSGNDTINTTDNSNEWIWIQNDQDGWIPARKISENESEIEVCTNNGTTLRLSQSSTKTLPLHESSLHSTEEDLVLLEPLNEAGITHNLKQRYLKNEIYTWVGAGNSVLVSVNPFKPIPALYTSQVMEENRVFLPDRPLKPHVFALANAAFESLLMEGTDQSILISGESGAGKTEATKQCLNFIAEAAAAKLQIENLSPNVNAGVLKSKANSNIEQKLLLANPILEAFGNAKTIRNDNSSRFGKWIEVHFDRQNSSICGARLSTYLLEKARVIHQQEEERNFHIFYQLFTNEDMIARFRLENGPEAFEYVKTCTDLDSIDDEGNLDLVLRSFELLGMSESERDWVFNVLAGVLHLGQIEFVEKSSLESSSTTKKGEVSKISSNPLHLELVSRFFGLEQPALESVLLNRSIEVRGERNVIPLKPSDAKDGRNSLAMAIYGNLFNKLVSNINESVNGKMSRFIGILDIFGFEIFQQNSFEQLCINYANEKLQQHFNAHTFKEEEALYRAEGIQFSPVVFFDNQQVLDLIEKKPYGILPVLDEEIKLPGGSDENFLKKLDTQNRGHSKFRTDVRRKLNPSSTFDVEHYAGKVSYNATGFVIKNKDTLFTDMTNVCSKSRDERFAGLFQSHLNTSTSSTSTANTTTKFTHGANVVGPNGFASNSLSNQFRKQLSDLMSLLNMTESRFIRCIKPNENKRPGNFHAIKCIAQLRYAGVFEACAIRKNGYPFRFKHQQFALRYGCINLTKRRNQQYQMPIYKNTFANGAELSKEIVLGGIWKSNFSTVQFGLNRVLYRAEHHRILELLRNIALDHVLPILQKVVRGHFAREFRRRMRNVEKKLEIAMSKNTTLEILEQAIATCYEQLGNLRNMFSYEPRNLSQARKLKRKMVEWKDICSDIRGILSQEEFDDFLYRNLESLLTHVNTLSDVPHSEADDELILQGKQKISDFIFMRIESDAKEALQTLERQNMERVIRHAKRANNYSSELIKEIESLLELKEEEFLKIQYKKAIELKNPALKKERERKLLDIYLATNQSLFRLDRYSKLRDPEEFASGLLPIPARALEMANKATQKKIRAYLDSKAKGMLEWTDKPIHTSLVEFSSSIYGPEAAQALSKDSVKCFKEIMAYMGDRTYPYPGNQAASSLLSKCLLSPLLRTEVLIQVMKQLVHNPRNDSAMLGWELFSMLLTNVPVESDFENVLVCWIRQKAPYPAMAEKLIDHIRNESENQSRIKPIRNLITVEDIPRLQEKVAISTGLRCSRRLHAINAMVPPSRPTFVRRMLKTAIGVVNEANENQEIGSDENLQPSSHGIRTGAVRKMTKLGVGALEKMRSALIPMNKQHHTYTIQENDLIAPSDSSPIKIPTMLKEEYARVIYDYSASRLAAESGNEENQNEENSTISIRRGDFVKVLEVQGEWLLAQYDNKEGWVPTSYIQRESNRLHGMSTANVSAAPSSAGGQNIVTSMM